MSFGQNSLLNLSGVSPTMVHRRIMRTHFFVFDVVFFGGEDTLARVVQGGWEQGLCEGALGDWQQLFL